MARPLALAVLASVVSLAVGIAVGRSWARPDAAPGVRTEPAAPSSPNTVPKAVRSLICAPVRRAAAQDASCDELELRERWCEAELADCSERRDAVRHPWPEADGVESPERWSAVVDEAFAACGIDAELEVIDCAEYPCTAAVRPKVPMPDAVSHERELERLTKAVRACPQLRAAFHVGAGQDDALDLFRLDAPCDGTHERFFALMAIDTQGGAFAEQQVSDDDIVERDVMRWMYRRGDDLVGLWPCPE